MCFMSCVHMCAPLDLLCQKVVNLSGILCNHFKRGFKCWKRIYELKLFQSALAIDEELSPICLSTALDSRLPHPLCSRLLFPQYGAPVALSPPFFRITVTHRVRLTIHTQYNGVECFTERKHHPCDEKWSYRKISSVLASIYLTLTCSVIHDFVILKHPQVAS